jgi:chaperonin cofactor prefoldin
MAEFIKEIITLCVAIKGMQELSSRNDENVSSLQRKIAIIQSCAEDIQKANIDVKQILDALAELTQVIRRAFR